MSRSCVFLPKGQIPRSGIWAPRLGKGGCAAILLPESSGVGINPDTLSCTSHPTPSGVPQIRHKHSSHFHRIPERFGWEGPRSSSRSTPCHGAGSRYKLLTIRLPSAAEHLKQSLRFLQLLVSYLKPNKIKQKKKPCWPRGRVREGVGQNTPGCALCFQLVPFFHTGFPGHFRCSFLWHSFPLEHPWGGQEDQPNTSQTLRPECPSSHPSRTP